jgi:phospholipid/cholesterol/gamma-HCH transport system substrate-binding protein
MASRSERVKAGIFVAACAAIFVAVLATLVGVKFLRRDREYRVLFAESVTGLDEGSQVTYKGVSVGRVSKIRFPPNDLTRVEVLLAIRSDIPIPMDSKASIRTRGITGINYIELWGGSNDAPLLAPGGEIASAPSLMGTITDKFPQILENMDSAVRAVRDVFNDGNQDRVRSILEGLDRTLGESRRPVVEGAESFRRVAAELERCVLRASEIVDSSEADLRALISSLRRSAESVERGIGGDDLAIAARNLREVSDKVKRWVDGADGGKILEEFGDVARNANRLVSRVDQIVEDEHGSVVETIRSLRDSSALLDEILRSLRDNPGLLFASPKGEHGSALR